MSDLASAVLALREQVEQLVALVRETAATQIVQAEATEELAKGALASSAAMREMLRTNEAIVNALPMIAKLLQSEDVLAREKKIQDALRLSLARNGTIIN
jgi:hypothetical protein